MIDWTHVAALGLGAALMLFGVKLRGKSPPKDDGLR